jgi:flagellar hook protein FlgE
MASTTALFTGLSGLTSNSRRLDVIGNNIANVNTTAFKSTRMSFAPTFSRNFSLGTAPGDTTGGSNPGQVGLGVTVGGTQRNFNNGAIGVTGVATDLAIEGDGFFIVNQSGSRFYTRAGGFIRNPENDLMTQSGAKVMGFGVDDQFNLVDGNLVELNIPVGTLTLAEQTDNVIFNGNMNASGEIASTGSIHETRAFFTDPAGTTPITAATDLLTTDIYVSDGAGGFTIAFDSSESGRSITIDGIEKGGKDLGSATFAISGFAVEGADAFGSTFGELLAFFDEYLGTDSSAIGGSSDLGGSVQINANGQIVVVGNEGTVQSLEIETGNITVNGPGGGLGNPMVMTKTGDADGESVRTSFVVYDSLGTPLTIDLSFVLQATNPSGGTTWEFIAESNASGENDRLLALGEVSFDSNGRFTGSSNQSFSIVRTNGATTPLTVNMDFDSNTDSITSFTDREQLRSRLPGRFPDRHAGSVFDRRGWSHLGSLHQWSHADHRAGRARQVRQPGRLGRRGWQPFRKRTQLWYGAGRQASRIRDRPSGRRGSRAFERGSLSRIHRHDSRIDGLFGRKPSDHNDR